LHIGDLDPLGADFNRHRGISSQMMQVLPVNDEIGGQRQVCRSISAATASFFLMPPGIAANASPSRPWNPGSSADMLQPALYQGSQPRGIQQNAGSDQLV